MMLNSSNKSIISELQNKILLLEKKLEKESSQRENSEQKNKFICKGILNFTQQLQVADNIDHLLTIIHSWLNTNFSIIELKIYTHDTTEYFMLKEFYPESNAANKRIHKKTLQKEKEIIKLLFKNKKPHITPLPNDSKLTAKNKDTSTQFHVAVPILIEGELMCIIDSQVNEVNLVEQEILSLFSIITDYTAITFKNLLVKKQNQSAFNKMIQNEDALIYNTEKFQSGIAMSNKKGQITWMNDPLKNFMSSYNLETVGVGEDNFKLLDSIKHAFKEPEKFQSMIKEYILKNKKGSKMEFILNNGDSFFVELIPLMEEDKYNGLIFVVNNTKLQNETINIIKSSERKYRGIIENMDLGLLEIGMNNKILRVYEQLCHMTNYKESELIGEDFSTLFKEDFKVKDFKNEQQNTSEQYYPEVRLTKKDGSFSWVLITQTPIFGPKGDQTATMVGVLNIDTQKALENDLKNSKLQLESVREAEKNFLATISHEIRNPLNAIIGIANLLYDTDLNKQQTLHLNQLKYSSNILHGLISKLLDISKIEKGKVRLTKKKINLSEMVNALIQIESFNLTDKKIEFKNNIPQNSDFVVNADPALINQVFMNLLNNAVKFTQEGEIKVEGRVIGSTKSFINLEFRVSDSGIGILEKNFESIFDLFQQANIKTRQVYGGSGLGLGIVKKLIELYDGSIRVESKIKKGSTFIFNINVQKSKQSALKFHDIDYRATEEKKLLVVEDSEINRYYLSGILNKMNVKHDVAQNGLVALEKLDKNKYDLILMDIRMPVLNGYKTTIKLRASKTNPNCDVPIIALTASALVDEKQKAMKAGMNHHLTKPFSKKDLSIVLHKFDIVSKLSDSVKRKYLFSPELSSVNLSSIYAGDIKNAIIMFELFLSVIKKEFFDLEMHLNLIKADKFSATAHKIKANFSLVGLDKLSKKMYEYENLTITQDNVKEIQEDFKKTEQEFLKGFDLVTKEALRMRAFLNK